MNQGKVMRRLGCSLALILTTWWVVGVGLREAEGQGRSVKPQSSVTATSTTLAPEELESKIRTIEADKGLDEALKNKLLELYGVALTHVEAAQGHAASALAYEQASQSAPAEIQKLNRTLERPEEVKPASPPTADLPLRELEKQQLKAEAELAALQSRRGEIEQQILESQSRTPVQIRDEIAATKADRAAIENDLKTLPGSQEPPLLREARQVALQARKQARTNEIHKLEQELLSYDLRLKLLTTQRDRLIQELALADAGARQIRDSMARQRQEEVKQEQIEAERAQLEAAGKHPAIRKLAGQNAQLSRELASVIAGLDQAVREREATGKRLDQLEQDFKSVKRRIEIAGLSQALGQILREQRRKLPELRWYERDTRERQQVIADLGLRQLRIEEDRRSLRGLKPVLDGFMSKDSIPLSPEEQNEIRSELAKLVKDQQELLAKLDDAYARSLQALGDLDFAQKQLVDKARQYALFLDERLLWIPSSRPIALVTVHDLGLATEWILAPPRWVEVSETLIASAQRVPLLMVLALLLLGALFWVRQRARFTLKALAEKINKPYSDRFIFTVQALALTLLVAAPWPLFLGFLGWWLHATAGDSEFARAAGVAFLQLAPSLGLFYAFQLLCRPKGVAELHFKWQQQLLKLFRWHLPWLMAIVLPALFVTSMVGWEVDEALRDSLGRLAFIISLIAFSVFLHRLLRPEGGALQAHLQQHPHGWLTRLRYVWYPMAVCLPLTLAMLAAIGYYYTAWQLEGQLVATVWLIAGAVITHDLVIRWLAVENRKLALIKAREKREAARAAEAAKATAGASGEAVPETLDVPEIDIPTINLQTRQLLRTAIGLSMLVGMWFIWAEVLPALRVLDEVTLWHYAVVAEGQERLEPVTLANLALALVLAMIAVVATRNLPGVLEIAVLRRLSIEPGSRYAITQVARYLLATIGAVAVFNAIGAQWSQIHWLVAALSVGLGFGLQEIFGNFVSGLILLFERPIRVGDVVTVGDLTGTVSRIRIRATTITDADKRELIVPNKALITDRVINWTLSDTTTRVVIPVGVAYGADLALAHGVIFETVTTHPLIMADPEPAVVIVGFAEGTINFEVRVFVRELGHRGSVEHELRLAIHDALRAHRIPAPLAERNVHVRSFVSSLQAARPREEKAPQSGSVVDLQDPT